MVTVRKGDLFESKAQTLVNTVNCVGVMGKGVALGFRKRFPDMFDDYVKLCNEKQVQLGRPYVYKRLLPPWILNFPTKDHWRSVARIADIVAGLDYLAAHYKEWGIESLAVPPLGCGEGQLDWRVVGPTLYRRLAELEIDVELYAPFDAPEAELLPDFLAAGGALSLPVVGAPVRLPPGEIALAAIVRIVEREPYHWPIGRIAFQKLAYFATQAGVPTELEYQRGSFGPFAPGLKRVQSKLINNGLVVEVRHRNMFEIRTGPTYRDAVEGHREELEKYRSAIENAADLLLRTDTRRAEVLATAHFAAQQLVVRSRVETVDGPSEQDVVDAVLEWKARRRPPLEVAEVVSAVRGLTMLGWIDVDLSEDLVSDPETAELVG